MESPEGVNLATAVAISGGFVLLSNILHLLLRHRPRHHRPPPPPSAAVVSPPPSPINRRPEHAHTSPPPPRAASATTTTVHNQVDVVDGNANDDVRALPPRIDSDNHVHKTAAVAMNWQLQEQHKYRDQQSQQQLHRQPSPPQHKYRDQQSQLHDHQASPPQHKYRDQQSQLHDRQASPPQHNSNKCLSAGSTPAATTAACACSSCSSRPQPFPLVRNCMHPLPVNQKPGGGGPQPKPLLSRPTSPPPKGPDAARIRKQQQQRSRALNFMQQQGPRANNNVKQLRVSLSRSEGAAIINSSVVVKSTPTVAAEASRQRRRRRHLKYADSPTSPRNSDECGAEDERICSSPAALNKVPGAAAPDGKGTDITKASTTNGYRFGYVSRYELSKQLQAAAERSAVERRRRQQERGCPYHGRHRMYVETAK